MRYILGFLLVLFSPSLFAQSGLIAGKKTLKSAQEDTSGLYGSLRGITFFRNNEYFNAYVDGYTLTGVHVRPELNLHLKNGTHIHGGVHLLKYSGMSKFSQVEPTFSVEQELTPGLKLIMGTINQNKNHQMIDPMYHSEKALVEPVENGLQFLFSNALIESDVWLNWKNYIFRNSPEQEIFEVGANINATIWSSKQARVQLPVQFLAQHRGGQIDTSTAPLRSVFNLAVGPRLTLLTPSFIFNSISMENFFVGYQDISPKKQLLFEDGNAYYGKVTLQNEKWVTAFSYWHAKEFIPVAGNPIYSVITEDNSVPDIHRTLLSATLQYRKSYGKVDFSFFSEIYFDMNNGNTDYTFGVMMRFRPEFFISPRN